jgi:hypothetical protein
MVDLVKKPKRDLAGITALVVAITGLFAVFIHKPTETAAQAGYIELTAVLLENQESARKNHEDILALRTYLDGYTHSHESIVTPSITVATPSVPAAASSGSPAPSGSSTLQSVPSPSPRPSPSPAASAVPSAVPSAAAVAVTVRTVSSAPPPPHVAPMAAPRRAKAAESIPW